MSVTVKTVEGANITGLNLVDGATSIIRISNTHATEAATIKVLLLPYDGKATEDATNLEGKEVATEGWVSVKKAEDSEWTQLSEPTTWPDSWDDLDTGLLEFELAALSYQDVNVKVAVPDGADSSGITHYALSVQVY